MPQKKSSPKTKKVVAKKVTKGVKAKTSVKSKKTAASFKGFDFKKSFFVKEQQEFHRNHPHLERFIIIYLGVIIVLSVLYCVRFGLMGMI